MPQALQGEGGEGMRDIVICMREEDFLHKTDMEMYSCYWSMGRIPKYFTGDNKVFIVTKHYVVGYINPLEFNPEDVGGETILWDGGNDFVRIQPIPCKPFRGFRYRWFDYSLVKDTDNEKR